MSNLDANNLNDLFAIDAPLTRRVRSWITEDLHRALDELEELRVEALLKPIAIDGEIVYRLTGELRLTALFISTTTHTLILDQSELSQ